MPPVPANASTSTSSTPSISSTSLTGEPPSPPASGPGQDRHCPGCGSVYSDADWEISCEDCTACDRCDQFLDRNLLIEALDGADVCPTCLRSRYWQCGLCDGWNRDGLACANDCTDAGDDQDDDEDGAGGVIHAYDFKPRPVFHGEGSLFLGLELEIATPGYRRQDAAETALHWLGHLGYLKADASIGGGFEIVTHPMTYPWAIDHFPWRMLRALHDSECTATDATGLHVHLSRAGFTGPGHTYRWMKFIYRNQHAVTTLARRTNSRWAEFHDDDRRAVKDYAKGTPGYYRYRAINTTNYDTFELRIFASSLQAAQVQAALAFAAASVEYTRTLTIPAITHHDGWAWPAFVTWLAGRPEYAPLALQVEALACVC